MKFRDGYLTVSKKGVINVNMEFEENNLTYSNYKVLIRAYLEDKDDSSKHYGEAEDYLIYTHAKNILEVYMKEDTNP